MPSKKKKKTTPPNRPDATVVFYPLLLLTLILWILYRSLFYFPVWFDEIIGKALFFGFPVWLYITISGSSHIADSFSLAKFRPGILLGLAVGGMFGFTTSVIALLQNGAVVEPVWLFSSNIFWKEFLLAIFTSFWETLLFFAFAMTVIMDKYPKWSMSSQAVFAAFIFMIFHIPNAFIRFEPTIAVWQILILFLFALGQGFLFVTRRNGYALVLSQAIWGMVLLTHSW